MDTKYVLNDLLDAIDILAKVVSELDPGRERDYRLLQFLLKRAEREIEGVHRSV